jgi:hypothetical protein
VEIINELRTGKRADIRCGIDRIADMQPGHRLDEMPLELVGDLFLNDKAFGGDTALAVVDGTGRNGGPGRLLQVGALHHDERIASSQFQHHFLEISAGRLPHILSRPLASRKGYGCYTAIPDDGGYLR